MTDSRPGGRPSPSAKGGPPVPASRRSARQRRISNREANRSLSRAGTGGSGGGLSPIWTVTIAAAAVALLVFGIFGANQLFNAPGGPKVLGTPFPPPSGFVTPADIPQDGRTLGYSDARATLELWEDFQCTVCYGFTVNSEPQVIANFVRNHDLKIVFKDLLVIGAPDFVESKAAANAALCGNDQGKFWIMHDWLYGNQGRENSGVFAQNRLLLIGQLAGLDTSKYDPCVQKGAHYSDIATEQSVRPSNSTPTLVLNGQILSIQDPTDYSQVAAALNAVLHPICATPTPSSSSSASATATASATTAPSPTACQTASPSPTPSASPSPSPSPTATPSGSASATSSSTASATAKPS